MNVRLRPVSWLRRSTLLDFSRCSPAAGRGVLPCSCKAIGLDHHRRQGSGKGYIQVSCRRTPRPATATIKPVGQFVLAPSGEDDGAVPGARKVTEVFRRRQANGMRTFGCPSSYADPATSGLEINVDNRPSAAPAPLRRQASGSWSSKKVIKEFQDRPLPPVVVNPPPLVDHVDRAASRGEPANDCP